jgi:hypothetical protein
MHADGASTKGLRVFLPFVLTVSIFALGHASAMGQLRPRNVSFPSSWDAGAASGLLPSSAPLTRVPLAQVSVGHCRRDHFLAGSLLGAVAGIGMVYLTDGYGHATAKDYALLGGGGALVLGVFAMTDCARSTAPGPASPPGPPASLPPRTPRPSERDEFCTGFSEGFKSVRGDVAMVPNCPITPVIPLGSTPRREGITAGIAAAGR